MTDIVVWILIIIGMTIPVLVGALFNYFLNKKKVQAETEEIKLKNQITKDITYQQLKKESKHKDVKNKIDILQKLIVLEEEIKSKEKKSISDQKKLESLEMIKKEFRQSFVEGNEEKPQLEANKETDKAIKKLKSTKINPKKKNGESKNYEKKK